MSLWLVALRRERIEIQSALSPLQLCNRQQKLFGQGLLLRFVSPEFLAMFRQGINWIIVFITARERFGVVGLDTGTVIFSPVGNAQLAIVFLQLVYPALSDKRYIANHARRCETR